MSFNDNNHWISKNFIYIGNSYKSCMRVSITWNLFLCNCAIWQLTNYWSVKWAVEIDWHFKEELNNRKEKFFWHVTNCYSLPFNLCCREVFRYFWVFFFTIFKIKMLEESYIWKSYYNPNSRYYIIIQYSSLIESNMDNCKICFEQISRYKIFQIAFYFWPYFKNIYFISHKNITF